MANPRKDRFRDLESSHPQGRMADNRKDVRTKRDAEDWSRRSEDEMVRGAYIQRATADRMTVEVALKRYLAEVVPTKRATSQLADVKRARILIKYLGKYSLAALTPELIARFRDIRLAGEDRLSPIGKPQPRANNTVRLDLALLGHLYTIAIKEWSVGLPSNPVMNNPQASTGTGAEPAHDPSRRVEHSRGSRRPLESDARLDRAHRSRNGYANLRDCDAAPGADRGRSAYRPDC